MNFIKKNKYLMPLFMFLICLSFIYNIFLRYKENYTMISDGIINIHQDLSIKTVDLKNIVDRVENSIWIYNNANDVYEKYMSNLIKQVPQIQNVVLTDNCSIIQSIGKDKNLPKDICIKDIPIEKRGLSLKNYSNEYMYIVYNHIDSSLSTFVKVDITKIYNIFNETKKKVGGTIFIAPSKEIFKSGLYGILSHNNIESNEINLLENAIANWDKQDKPFKFIYNNNTYWSILSKNVNSENTMWIGLVLSEKEIEKLYPNTKILSKSFLAVAILHLIFFIFCFIIYRKFSQNINLEYAKNLIFVGENDKVEFKSTVRTNMHTKKKDEDMEHAILKSISGFLNGKGGYLFIGVNDHKEIIGIQKEEQFTTPDHALLHLKNIIIRNLGTLCLKYITMYILFDGDKYFIIIECISSPLPVILKTGNRDYFYLRTGPSTTELGIADTLRYLRRRNFFYRFLRSSI